MPQLFKVGQVVGITRPTARGRFIKISARMTKSFPKQPNFYLDAAQGLSYREDELRPLTQKERGGK